MTPNSSDSSGAGEGFGATIRLLRRVAGLRQSDVVDAVQRRLLDSDRSAFGRGFGGPYLSKIEHGAAPPPSVPIIIHLAAVLGADADDLLALAGKPPAALGTLLQQSVGARRFYRLKPRGGARGYPPPPQAANLDDATWDILSEQLQQLVRAGAGGEGSAATDEATGETNGRTRPTSVGPRADVRV